MFQPFNIVWEGKDHSIPHDRKMMAGAVVEKVITLGELFEQRENPNKVRILQLCQAYGALLRFAGARVTDEEVRDKIFEANGVDAKFIGAAIGDLLTLFLPPNTFQAKTTSAKPRPTKRARKAKARS